MRMRRRKGKGRGIYLLPNLLTTMSLFAGFYSMVATIDRKFTHAAIAIFVSAVFDMLDGRVARLTNSSSKFGVQYDSLSDVIAFGVAPALLAYMWALKGYGRFGWLAAFLYVACGALRLARFNVQVETVQKKQFLGLPIPAAAAAIASSVLFYSWLGYRGGLKNALVPVLIYIVALLMVSDVRYYSFKDIGFLWRRPFRSTVAAIVLLVIIFVEPELMLFIAAFAYVLSGPVYTLIMGRRTVTGDAPHREDSPALPGGRR